MKKTLSFIPLGIGISSMILYVFNIIKYRLIRNAMSVISIASSLRIYLIIAVISFIVYFLIKLLEVLQKEGKELETKEVKTNSEQTVPTSVYDIANEVKKQINEESIKQIKEEKIVVGNDNMYCYNCGAVILKTDKFCHNCGTVQNVVALEKHNKKLFTKIVDVLEIIILILVIYFALAMMFEYREKTDSNFVSPFKVSMTK